MPGNPKNPFDKVVGFLDAAAEALPTRPERERRMRALAERLGLEYTHKDHRNLEGTVRFPSLLTGGPSGIENVLTGRWKDLAVRVFDRWQYRDVEDEKTHRTHREWSRHNCVLTRLGLRATEPFLLEREGVFGRLADHLGMRDIELELEDFNRAYTVRSKDRKFATDLLDQRMMSWLLETKDQFPQDVSIQIDRRQLLLWCPERKPGQLIPLLRLVKDFVDHFPPVAFSLYGVEDSTTSDPSPSEPRGRPSNSS